MTERTLRIGHLSTVNHTAFILMGNNSLSEQGIRAKWELYPSGPDIIRAMEGGEIDLAYIGLPPFIIGIDRGLQAVCIAGGHVEGTVIIGGSDMLPLDTFPGMEDFLLQFSEKSIGCPPKGSIHDIIVRNLIQGYGISATVINYAWADFLNDALDDGEIVAAAGTPALAVASHRYGNAHIIVPPDKLWPSNPSYGLVATRELLSDEPLLTGFLTAHEEASELIRHNPFECARIVAEQTGFVDAEYVMEVYQISPHYCTSLSQEYIDSTEAFAHTLFQLGSTKRLIRINEIFDTRFINTVHSGSHHYRGGIDYLPVRSS